MKKLALLIIIVTLFSCNKETQEQTMLDRLAEVELWQIDYNSPQLISLDYSDSVYDIHPFNSQIDCYINLNLSDSQTVDIVKNSYSELELLITYNDGYSYTLRFYNVNGYYFHQTIYDYEDNLSVKTLMNPSTLSISDLNYCD
jgi:hypothetical protein